MTRSNVRHATLLVAGALLATTGAARSEAATPPDGQTITRVVRQYLTASDRSWRPTDLIVRSQVRGILASLDKLGWKVSDSKQILRETLADNDPLVAQLETEQGRVFMRQIATMPNGYDRIDRLRYLPRGERYLHDLIRGPGGEELIDYMATTRGGEELGRMLSEDPDGAHFNRPTGRIYTERDLLDRLGASYRRDFPQGATK